jgi:hypothetical protein
LAASHESSTAATARRGARAGPAGRGANQFLVTVELRSGEVLELGDAELARRARNAIPAATLARVLGDDAVQLRVIDPASHPLIPEGAHTGCAVRRGARSLERREKVLDPIVGRQCAGHQPWKQKPSFTQNLDHSVLRHHAPGVEQSSVAIVTHIRTVTIEANAARLAKPNLYRSPASAA